MASTLRIEAAKLAAIRARPYFALLAYTTPIILTSSIPTAAMDLRGRLWLNPEFGDSLTIKQLAGCFLHEWEHALRFHVPRMMGTNSSLFNQAADAEIHQADDIKSLLADIPGGFVTVESLGIPASRKALSAEQIYAVLVKNQQQKDKQQKDKQDKKSEPKKGNGKDKPEDKEPGKGNDKGKPEDKPGKDKPADKKKDGKPANGDGKPGDSKKDGKPAKGKGKPAKEGSHCASDKLTPELQERLDKEAGNQAGPSKPEQQEVRAATARAIKKVAKAKASKARAAGTSTRGLMPGNIGEWAEAETNPVVTPPPWQQLFAAAITDGSGSAAPVTTYSRSYRRQDSYGWDDFILPGQEAQMFAVGIIVDISGSMRSFMPAVLDSISNLLRAVPGVTIQVAFVTTRVMKVSRFATVTPDIEKMFAVGGGTDMRAGFTYFDKKPTPPKLVICVTDGETPYPSVPTKHRYKVIVLLSQEGTEKWYPVPRQYKTIIINNIGH